MQCAVPVREDDARCIRAAPPRSDTDRPPPRFAVGARVEVMGPATEEGAWEPATVLAHWVADSRSGGDAPYLLELANGRRTKVLLHHDVAAAIQLLSPVQHTWDDDAGLQAAYDLLVGTGQMIDVYARATERAAAASPASAASAASTPPPAPPLDRAALTDAVAASKSPPERRATMLQQIVAMAEAVTPHVLSGKRVRVRGLESRADLNGKIGLAVRFSEARGRYEVAFEQGGGTMRVRGVNLELAATMTVTCPICMDCEMTDPLGPAMQGPQSGCAVVTSCCGKVICSQCHDDYTSSGIEERRSQGMQFPPCPFCREPFGYFDAGADQERSKGQLKRRATQADAVACYNLSGSYDKGNLGLPRDYEASAAWAALAVLAGGHVRAMNNLGFAFRDGEGVEQSESNALPWFVRAAESGHIGSIWALGKAYRDGRGASVDLVTAAKWFRRGFEMGDWQCRRDLGRLPPPHNAIGDTNFGAAAAGVW